jgi:hypothetical protein
MCPRGLRRGGGGTGGVLRALDGEAAREDASEDATMAFASESMVAAEGDVRRRRGLVMPRLGGRDG